jgi:hypothetical protein
MKRVPKVAYTLEFKLEALRRVRTKCPQNSRSRCDRFRPQLEHRRINRLLSRCGVNAMHADVSDDSFELHVT